MGNGWWRNYDSSRFRPFLMNELALPTYDLSKVLNEEDPGCSCDYSRGQFSCRCERRFWVRVNQRRNDPKARVQYYLDLWSNRSTARLNELLMRGFLYNFIDEGYAPDMPADLAKWTGTREGERHPRYPAFVWASHKNYSDPLSPNVSSWVFLTDQP